MVLASLVLILTSTIALAATPEYSVVITSEKPAVNPGENLNFTIWITGGGEPPIESKVAAYTDGSYVITWVLFKIDPDVNPLEINAHSFVCIIPSKIFNVHPSHDSMIVTEVEGAKVAGTMGYEVFIPKDIRPGDHETHVVFSYNDGTKWHTEEATFKFHVNTPWEIYQLYFEIYEWYIATLGLIVTIIIAFLSFKRKKK